MVIKKIIADRRPMFCCECPLYCFGYQELEDRQCGKMETIEKNSSWSVGGMVPDERCLIEVEE